jgi:hypothetical protein
MTVPVTDDLFRTEALEYFATQDGPGQLLQSPASARMTLLYRAFLALVGAGVIALLLIQVDGGPLIRVLLPATSRLFESLHG